MNKFLKMTAIFIGSTNMLQTKQREPSDGDVN